jgi:O-antigen/teichoic acid export membrane protein
MLDKKNYSIISKVSNQLLVVYGVVSVMFILIVPECFKLLFPVSYHGAIWCVPPLVTGTFFMFLYTMFVNVEEYFEKTNYVVSVSVTCGVINVILNYFCIKKFGYIACAYTTEFSYALFAVGHYMFMKKAATGAGVADDIADAKVVAAISLIVIICSVGITCLYNLSWVRYGIFTIIIIIAIHKRRYLISLYKQMKKS